MPSQLSRTVIIQGLALKLSRALFTIGVTDYSMTIRGGAETGSAVSRYLGWMTGRNSCL